MVYVIRSDIKRAVSSKGFLLAITTAVLMILLSSLNEIIEISRSTGPLPYGYHARLIISALSSDTMTLTVPIICTLPYTTAYIDDIKSGFIKEYLPRSGINRYIKGKLMACGLSGGLVLFLGILSAYSISALVFMPMELASYAGKAAEPHFAVIFTKALMLFFSGMFWSILGFTLAALTMNRYMAYASPFIFYYVLIIIHERYFKELYVLYPKEWMSPSKDWVLGEFGVILFLLELTAIVCLWFATSAKRTLANV